MTDKQPINPLDILLQLDWAEGDDLEFKSAKGGLPKSLWETYSAMANAHGGVILLGVEDDGRVSGVHEPRKLKKSFWDTVNNRGKVSLNLCTDTDLAEVTHPGGLILAIRIPQATRYQRPIFLGQNPLTGTYRRNYEGDYRCTPQEVGRMLSDQAEEPADSRILEGFEMEDLDLPSLHQYRQRLASHKPTHPWLSEDDVNLLAKLGGWRRDRKTGTEGLTVAGLLMFGRDETLREGVPGYHVDYRERLSDDPAERWSDRLTVDGTWQPNLFQFYLRVAQRLVADLKLPFQLDADLFRKGETEVHEAIREALVNALIHADYKGQGGIVVEKFRDAFEFSNPGTLLISFDQLLQGNVSECRNKALQIMFMLIGAAEKAGSGVDKMRKGWASQHWRSPMVREQVQPERVTWRLPMVSLIPDESLTRLEGVFGRKFNQFSPNEVQALVTADVEGTVDNSRMRQICTIHAADVTRLLQGLVAKGALVQEGQGRWSRYRLPEPVPSVHKTGSSVHKTGSSVHKTGSSVHKTGSSVHKTADSVHSEKLRLIAQPARDQQRLQPDAMERIILELCRGRWLTRNQLSELVDRHADGLRSRFLTPMVAHGRLRLRYPDKPNRADQAYTSDEGVRENAVSSTKQAGHH
ncbi:RNA-binding domain-containing protein [Methylohalobius crimeensis]|uniref:RNA-binding domain-containing protein n=1 Tax=Methylohalobius crimeensis TaxID=244365 RepID=UPI0003B76A5B|nr:RNA-binding domain-containing protein [Methylohalobius crimeensis]